MPRILVSAPLIASNQITLPRSLPWIHQDCRVAIGQRRVTKTVNAIVDIRDLLQVHPPGMSADWSIAAGCNYEQELV